MGNAQNRSRGKTKLCACDLTFARLGPLPLVRRQPNIRPLFGPPLFGTQKGFRNLKTARLRFQRKHRQLPFRPSRCATCKRVWRSNEKQLEFRSHTTRVRSWTESSKYGQKLKILQKVVDFKLSGLSSSAARMRPKRSCPVPPPKQTC